MLSYSDIKPKMAVVIDDEPYEIVSTSGVVKKQRQKPHNTAKLRNILSGSVIERTFTQADKIEEAEIDIREVKYLYSNRGESWFCVPSTPKERFAIPSDTIERQLPYMKENVVVEALLFDENIFDIRIPVKVELKVVEAPPNIKGNTAQGGVKVVVLETGATVNAPMFINAGDTIRVNTDTGEYAERV